MKERNEHGRVVPKGDTERRIKEREISRKLRLRPKPPPSKHKTPKGERNEHKRLIWDDWDNPHY